MLHLLCWLLQVPAPVAITDDELIKLLEQDDQNAGGYRIPMSLGEPHAELDNSESHSRLWTLC